MRNFITQELREKRRRAGRLGGYATSSRHRDRMRDWGALGGRPRLPTLEELNNQSGSRNENKKRRRGLQLNIASKHVDTMTAAESGRY